LARGRGCRPGHGSTNGHGLNRTSEASVAPALARRRRGPTPDVSELDDDILRDELGRLRVILVATGPLVAAALHSAVNHARCMEFFTARAPERRGPCGLYHLLAGGDRGFEVGRGVQPVEPDSPRGAEGGRVDRAVQVRKVETVVTQGT